MNGHSFLNISNKSLLHIATHLFTKSVSCPSAKFTTGDFECMVCLKKSTLKHKGSSLRNKLLEQLLIERDGIEPSRRGKHPGDQLRYRGRSRLSVRQRNVEIIITGCFPPVGGRCFMYTAG